MRKAIDLTGQKFGKWTVIKKSNKQTSSCNTYWVCQCECGVIKDVYGDYQNNNEENLILLCPNCHSLTPTYKALNKGSGRKERKKYSLYEK